MTECYVWTDCWSIGRSTKQRQSAKTRQVRANRWAGMLLIWEIYVSCTLTPLGTGSARFTGRLLLLLPGRPAQRRRNRLKSRFLISFNHVYDTFFSFLFLSFNNIIFLLLLVMLFDYSLAQIAHLMNILFSVFHFIWFDFIAFRGRSITRYYWRYCDNC